MPLRSRRKHQLHAAGVSAAGPVVRHANVNLVSDPASFRLRFAPALLAAMLFPASALAQNAIPPNPDLGIDPALARQMAAIGAIDNHAHPVLPPPADATDRDFDALPVDDMEPETDITAWRPDNPQLPAAWKALWNFDGAVPLDAAGIKRLQAARAVVKAREGARFDSWVLEQAGTRTMLANRVAMTSPDGTVMGPGFRWVPYIDALLFPLDNSGLAAANPDRHLFFPLEDKLRARYLAAVHLQAVPATLAEYLAAVVIPTLERQKAGGALAEKFEVAYLRDFNFTDVSEQQAAAIYARSVGGGQPDLADYKLLQDFLFRTIAAECGRLGMAVHLHTMSGGGGYFSIGGDNPLLLESIFNDPRLRKTNFVLLHGGWPFVREAGALLQKPNVFLDLSQETLSFSPRTMSLWLREWLETFPDKVLFGTDGYPYSDAMGWEESAWIASHNGRNALGLALTGMEHDGEISPERAREIAAKVLHGNAAALYRIP